MSVKSFSEFISIKESQTYSTPGIRDVRGGGIEIDVHDASNEDDEHEHDKISVTKRNGTSVCLSYVNDEGKELESLWLPLSGLNLIEDSNGKITKIVLDPYKKWILSGENFSKVDDFIESFTSYLEGGRSSGSISLETSAKDDVEMVLDVLGIPYRIKEFRSGDGEYCWEAILDNGSLVEIIKRSKDDLMGSFNFYDQENSHIPSLSIKNSGSKKTSIFTLPDNLKIEEEIGISGLRKSDPYYNYLLKKAINTDTKSDEDKLVEYFKDLVSKGYHKPDDSLDPKENSEKQERSKRIVKILRTFLPLTDVEYLCAG